MKESLQGPSTFLATWYISHIAEVWLFIKQYVKTDVYKNRSTAVLRRSVDRTINVTHGISVPDLQQNL